MIKCTVEEDSMGHLTVSFENGKSIYLQGDVDRANFIVQCGLFKAPDDWDGCPTSLDGDWWDVDTESITECLEDYERIAEDPNFQ